MKFRSLQPTFSFTFSKLFAASNVRKFPHQCRSSYVAAALLVGNQRGCRRERCSNGACNTLARVQDTRVRATRIGSVLVARRTAKWPPTTVEAHTNDASTRTRFRNETACACGCVHATRSRVGRACRNGGKKRKKREREKTRWGLVRRKVIRSLPVLFLSLSFFFFYLDVSRTGRTKVGFSIGIRLISAIFVQSQIPFAFGGLCLIIMKCYYYEFQSKILMFKKCRCTRCV